MFVFLFACLNNKVVNSALTSTIDLAVMLSSTWGTGSLVLRRHVFQCVPHAWKEKITRSIVTGLKKGGVWGVRLWFRRLGRLKYGIQVTFRNYQSDWITTGPLLPGLVSQETWLPGPKVTRPFRALGQAVLLLYSEKKSFHVEYLNFFLWNNCETAVSVLAQ